MLHGLLLRARCDDLFLAGRFRRGLPPHLVGLGLELLLLDLRLLELQGVTDLLGLELLGQQLLHAGPIIRRQIHLPHVDAAQHQSHGIELGLELGDQLALDVRAPLREDLAHGVPGKGGIDDSLDRWRDQVRADVVGKFLRHLREAGSIDGPANREVDADRQTLDGLERSGARWRSRSRAADTPGRESSSGALGGCRAAPARCPRCRHRPSRRVHRCVPRSPRVARPRRAGAGTAHR